MKPSFLAVLLTSLLAAGCADDFVDYNQIVEFRVLALRATPPDVAPGETATLDALVTSSGASFVWTWCPLPFAGPAFDRCPISYEDLVALIRTSGSDAVPPPYELGTSPAVDFEHTLPPELLAAFCESAGELELPEGVVLPDCQGRFEVSIRAEISSAATTIAATRPLDLIYDDEVIANQNPAIEGGEISVRGAPPFELSGDQPTRVARDVRYTLELDIADEQSEAFEEIEGGETVTERETLVVSWFYLAGDIDEGQTSFNEGVTDFDNLRTNEYRTPTEDELDQDEARLFFVLRDERGGVGWFVAELELGL